MPINIDCNDCGKSYSVPDELAGKKIRCKQCSVVISIPASEDDWDLVELPDEEDDAGESLAPLPKKKKKSVKSSRKSQTSGVPGSIVLALCCLGGMLLVSALDAIGALVADPAALGVPPNTDPTAYKIGFVFSTLVRLIIQLVVFVAILNKSSGARTPAMVMAGLMALILCFRILGAITMGDVVLLAILVVSVVARVVFVVCLLTPSSEDHFQ